MQTHTSVYAINVPIDIMFINCCRSNKLDNTAGHENYYYLYIILGGRFLTGGPHDPWKEMDPKWSVQEYEFFFKVTQKQYYFFFKLIQIPR